MVGDTLNPTQGISETNEISERGGQEIRFEFTGNGFEYFKIWIVNVALTILTLGIYSAWAKVRRKRYFYGNTRIAGSSFEYTADPLVILKGRAIAFLFLMAFVFIATAFPLAEPFLWLLFMPFLPWVLIKALQFNALNSAYRNIRFNFQAEYKNGAIVFLLIPLAIVFSLGLAYPWFAYRERQFVVNHHRYGQSAFVINAKVMEFYKIYGLALLIVFAAVTFIGAVFWGADQVFPFPGEDSDFGYEGLWGLAFPICIIPVYLGVFAFLQASLQNLVWSRSRLENIKFRSGLRTLGIFWLYLTNSIAIIATIGLFIPWAQIRMIRYRLEHLSLSTTRTLDHFIADEQQKSGATGEEVGEMFDLDISL